MKILVISGSPIMGGAEQAARRLVEGLAKNGIEVIYFGVFKEKLKHEFIQHYYPNNGYYPKKILKILHYFSYSYSYHQNTKSIIQVLNRIIEQEQPDIINVHNIKQSFWSPDLIAFCAEKAPLFWTLHEMSSFTGRCTYALNCKKYISGCDETCPNIHIPFIIPRKLTKQRWLHQKRVLEENPNIIAICPSQWLAERAKESLWKNNHIEVIPNCVNTKEFRPIPKKIARERLGLPQNMRLILCSAYNLRSHVKGSDLLMEACKKINLENLGLITMGHKGFFSPHIQHFPVFNLGFIPPNLRPYVYSAADLFVHPSRAESFGLVIIEANACGTPVIAFANSAIQEIIEEDINGWLVSKCTSEALAQKIEWFFHNKLIFSEKIGQKCTDLINLKYSLDGHIKRYTDIFSGALLNE